MLKPAVEKTGDKLVFPLPRTHTQVLYRYHICDLKVKHIAHRTGRTIVPPATKRPQRPRTARLAWHPPPPPRLDPPPSGRSRSTNRVHAPRLGHAMFASGVVEVRQKKVAYAGGHRSERRLHQSYNGFAMWTFQVNIPRPSKTKA